MAQKQKHWVDNRYPGYDEGKRRRNYARDQYSGDVYDIVVAQAKDISDQEKLVAKSHIEEVEGVRIMRIGGHVGDSSEYLFRREQGESGLAYYERARISRFPNHMTALVDSYVGGAMAVEGRKVVEWGDILGDPADDTSEIFDIWRDVDGTGLNWGNSLVRAAKDVIVDHWVIEYVDVNEDGRGYVYRIDPNNVLNIREEDGRIVQLLLYTPKWEVSDLKDENGARLIRYYTLFDLDGWTKYIDEENEQKERTIREVDSAPYKQPIYTDSTRTKRQLPFNFVELGIDRNVGYQMAVDHNQLYNLLSDGRWNFRTINYPRLVGDVEDKQWINTMEALRQGMNALQGDWRFESPDADNGAEATKMYQREVQSYYVVNHQRMNGVSIERSATEVAFDEAAGRTSFLTILVGALDEIENGRLFLLSQMLRPSRPNMWSDANVHRSRDFRPIDMLTEIQSQSNNFAALVAAGVPLRRAAEIVTQGFTDELIDLLPEEVRPSTTVMEIEPEEDPQTLEEEEDGA